MTLRIRMQRQGRANRAHYRIGVFDQRTRRGGRAVELLGHYDPHNDKLGVRVDQERLSFHLANGAQLTEKCASLLRRAGLNTDNPVASKRRRHKRARKAPKVESKK